MELITRAIRGTQDVLPADSYKSVSYTHLDVYKRQDFYTVMGLPGARLARFLAGKE